MDEPDNGSMVIVGEAPFEVVFVRDDNSFSPEADGGPWYRVEGGSDEGESWIDVLSEGQPNSIPQRLYTAVGLWQTLHRHLEDAHNASGNPDFDAGLAFAANLLADTLHLTRPPWAAFRDGGSILDHHHA